MHIYWGYCICCNSWSSYSHCSRGLCGLALWGLPNQTCANHEGFSAVVQHFIIFVMNLQGLKFFHAYSKTYERWLYTYFLLILILFYWCVGLDFPFWYSKLAKKPNKIKKPKPLSYIYCFACSKCMHFG